MDRIVDRINDYEAGTMTEQQVIDFFIDLINTGVINSLQGSYQRTAKRLIQFGYIVMGEGKAARGYDNV